MNSKVDLSVIIIISETQKYDDIYSLHQIYKDSIDSAGMPYEMIYVTDGESANVLQDLLSLSKSEDNMKIVKLGKWFGFATALNAGFENANGKYILSLPSYQQINSIDIPNIINSLRTDVDMVIARRVRSLDTGINQFQTKIFHRMVKKLTGVEFNDLGCKVRAFKREVLETIYIYGDQFRFLPLLAQNHGFTVSEVIVTQLKSDSEKRVYSLGHYLQRFVDFISIFFLLRFTKKPLRFFGFPGLVLFISGALLGLYLIFERIALDVPLASRPILLASLFLIVFGVQLFAIGLVAEIIIFTHSKESKDYIIEKVINSKSEVDHQSIEID